jgi:hypothetical protein
MRSVFLSVGVAVLLTCGCGEKRPRELPSAKELEANRKGSPLNAITQASQQEIAKHIERNKTFPKSQTLHLRNSQMGGPLVFRTPESYSFTQMSDVENDNFRIKQGTLNFGMFLKRVIHATVKHQFPDMLDREMANFRNEGARQLNANRGEFSKGSLEKFDVNGRTGVRQSFQAKYPNARLSMYGMMYLLEFAQPTDYALVIITENTPEKLQEAESVVMAMFSSVGGK